MVGHLPDAPSREALAQLLLHSTGRYVGALASGRLDAGLTAARELLSAPPPPVVAALLPPDAAAAAPAGRGGAAAGADEVLSTWSGCMGRGAGGLTSLRVSLAGRLPPREINALLGALLGVLPPYDEVPEPEDDGDADSLDDDELAPPPPPAWPAAPTQGAVDGGCGALRTARARTARRSSVGAALLRLNPPGTAASDGTGLTGPATGPGLGGFSSPPGSVGWLVRLPLQLPQLAGLVRELLDSRQAALEPPAASAVASRAASTTTTASRYAGPPPAHAASAPAPPLPRVSLSALSLSLLDEAGATWGVCEAVRPCAAALLEGYFAGGHVALVAEQPHLAFAAAALAALAAGAHVTAVEPPPRHRPNGGMPPEPAPEFGLRGLFLRQVRRGAVAGCVQAGAPL